MSKPFPLLALSVIAMMLVGCSSRPIPDLYEPGDIPTWRTVKTPGSGDPAAAERPQVVLNTSMGDIVIELYEEHAPLSTDNFLQYVGAGHYDNVLFHRVIPGFMVQGGGFSVGLVERPTRAPIPNESDNGLRNRRGTVAMARTSDPDSATAQFFINLVDNAFLDPSGGGADGYAVFGRVVQGMSVVDAIANVQTESRGGMDDVPVENVRIVTARRLR